jgi:putative addiction module component (TIGR02574 family)
MSRRDVLQAALKLPPEERATLARDILASLGPPAGLWSLDEPGFIDELDRRVAEAKKHPETLTPARVALSRVRTSLRKQKK